MLYAQSIASFGYSASTAMEDHGVEMILEICHLIGHCDGSAAGSVEMNQVGDFVFRLSLSVHISGQKTIEQ